jgi:hypothetical protein
MYINFHSIISIYNTRQLLLNQLLLSIACREGGGGDFSNGLTYKRHKTAHALCACNLNIQYLTAWSITFQTPLKI